MQLKTILSPYSSDVITSSMFGGNQLFRYDLLVGQNGSYSTAVDLLGVADLRYPGGTMTELNFDVNNPDSRPLGVKVETPFVGVSEFLNFAAASSRSVNMVLPTKGLYSGVADALGDNPREINQSYLDSVVDFVRLLLTHGDQGPAALPDTQITTFEIGNEYYLGGKMTAREYGQAANALASALDKVFDEFIGNDESRPGVVVQMGVPVDTQFSTGIYSSLSYSDRLEISNKAIIQEISDPNAVDTITGLVRHYYYTGQSDALVQSTWSMNSIDNCLKLWADAGYADRDIMITEWNVGLENSSQLGLKGASTFIEQMNYMNILGVDSAFAWPVQDFKNGLVDGTGTEVTVSPIGAAFKLMAESLPGTQLLPFEITGGSLEVNCYGSDTRAVIFISSRDYYLQSVDIDLSGIFSDIENIGGTKIGILPGWAVDDPDARAEISTSGSAQVYQSGALHFDLKPFEVMRIEFDYRGFRFLGNLESESIKAGGGADTVQGAAGSDSIIGSSGDDIISGNKGTDILYGGDGSDWVSGGWGDDKLFGGLGDDAFWVESIADVVIEYAGEGTDLVESVVTWTLSANVEDLRLKGLASTDGTGNALENVIRGNVASNLLSGVDGNDTIFGGGGSDSIDGGEGGDSLVGDSGNDTLLGGAGNDLLNGGFGKDELSGGSGADQFVFVRLVNSVDVITDFNAADGDVLRFDGLELGTFAYLGAGTFTGGADNGEARVVGSQVQVDINGDAITDIEIYLVGLTNAAQLTADSFLFL